jgi:ribosomal protein L37AE/L43A
MKRFHVLLSLCCGLALGPVAALRGADAIKTGDPAPVSVEVKRPASPFLLLTPDEIAELKIRITKNPEAAQAWNNLVAKVESYIAKPLRFPEHEGGWTHKYVCPNCGSSLTFNPDSPHRHHCDICDKMFEGEALDQAWNSTAMLTIASRMEETGAAALLGDDPRYARELKTAWLDLAGKYETYRFHEKDMKLSDTVRSTAGRALPQSIDESNLLTKLAYSWDALLGTNVLNAEERAFVESKVWALANPYYHRILDLHGSGGNWRIWCASGAMTVGLFTDDKALMEQAFNAPGYGIMAMLNSGYINEEGLVEERSAGYQNFAMEALSRMAHIAKRIGIPLYQNPRVEAGFTAYMDLLLPDLSVPCMNDGWRYRFADASSPSHSDKTKAPLDLLDLGWNLYHSSKIMATLTELQTSPTVSAGRLTRLYALIYGPKGVKPADVAFPSAYLPESGIALLRSPTRDWTCLLKNNPDPKGHAHPDALQIGMFANGEEFIPSFGTPAYGSKFSGAWFKETLANNTLVINMLSQNLRQIMNQLDWGITSGPVQAAHGSTRNVQQKEDSGPSVSLTRTILFTPLAMYEILRVAEDATAKKKSEGQPVNLLDSVLHFNGQLTWKITPTTAAAPWKEKWNSDEKYAPYQYLRDFMKFPATSAGVIQGELTQPKGGKVALALFPPTPEETIYQAMGPGFEETPSKFLPMVFRRLPSNNARFGSIAIPFQGTNPLTSVTMLIDTPASSVFTVETTGGNEIVFQSEQPTPLNAGQAKLTFTGSLGVISEPKGGPKQYTLLGSSLSDATGILSTDKPVPVQMTLESNGPVFTNLGNEPVRITWTPAGITTSISNTIQPAGK